MHELVENASKMLVGLVTVEIEASVPGTKTCTEFEFPEGLFYGRKLAEYSAGFRAKNTSGVPV